MTGTAPLKRVASINPEELPGSTPEDRQIEYIDIGSVGRGKLVTPPISFDFGSAPSRARRVVREGDSIVSTVRTYLRAVLAIPPELDERVVSTGFAVVRPISIDSGFLGWVLQSDPFIEEVISRSVGVSYPAVNPSEIGAIHIPVSTPTEQRHLARYLDAETGRIDAVITSKRRLIELLEEKRTALIGSAVTRGLDYSVPMKDSGVDWVGEVPAHWAIGRLKHGYERLVDTEHKTVHFVDDGEYMVVRTPDVRRGHLLMDGALRTDFEGFEEWTRRGRPKPGDVLLTREAPAGEACLVPPDVQLCLGQRMVMIRTNPSVLLPAFLVYWIYSEAVQTAVDLGSQGSTVRHLNMSDIPNLPLAIPPLAEQATIVDELDRVTSQIAALQAAVSHQLALLAEFRQALITSTVTGETPLPSHWTTGEMEAAS